MTRERCSEGWVVDGEPNKTQTSQMDPKITGTIDRDKYNRTVIGPYDHGPLHPPPLASRTILQLAVADCGVTSDALAVVTPKSSISMSSCGTGTERFALSSTGAGNAVASEVNMKRGGRTVSGALRMCNISR